MMFRSASVMTGDDTDDDKVPNRYRMEIQSNFQIINWKTRIEHP